VLVVEDEGKILRSLERGLRAEGYEVVRAADGNRGRELALGQVFDCIVLDLALPGRGGLQILNELRQAGRRVPVLILTARDGIDDRVTGLDAGADDYLVKPFAFAELLARLRVLLRRAHAEPETVLRARGLEMDLLQRRVSCGGGEITLTQREFEVLEYLLRHKNAVVTREMFGREVWKEPDYVLTNVIEVSINNVRRKLGAAGVPPLIRTIRGVGYVLED
jgi:DNA-binding response OmpR family regulator